MRHASRGCPGRSSFLGVAIDCDVASDYISGMKAVTYTAAASKTLRRMPRNTAERIRAKVSAYAADPASQANNVKALKGFDGAIRLRVGDWRVIMLDGEVIEVVKVAPRGGAYD